jgi:hypothetical protein
LYETNIGFIKKMIRSGRRVNGAVRSLSLFTIRDNLFTLRVAAVKSLLGKLPVEGWAAFPEPRGRVA